jgi:uncharacterized protein YceK
MSARCRLLALVCLAMSGCYSTVTVQKAKPGAPGVRYSLPAPYLLVEPGSDGTATYTWLYLPDASQQYVVTANSFLAKYTLDVKTSNGLLTQVGESADSTDVASKLLSSLAAADKAGQSSAGKNSSKTGSQSSQSSNGNGTSQNAQGQSNQAAPGQPTTTQETKTDASGKKTTTTTTTMTQPNATPAKVTSTGGIQKAYGPVLLKLIQDANGGVSLIPVNFPALSQHGAMNEIAAQKSGQQSFFETNTLTQTMTFSAKQGTVNAQAVLLSSSVALEEISVDPKSPGVTADASNSDAKFTAKILSIQSDANTHKLITAQLDTPLAKGIFHLHFLYRVKTADAQSSADVPVVITDAGP